MFESVLLFWLFVVTVSAFYLLFRYKIRWKRLMVYGERYPQRSFILGKLKKSSLYQVALDALNLEEKDVEHCENIADNFSSFNELSNAIRNAGLETSNLIIGVDFTASNEWQGRVTMDGKSLHSLSSRKRNPYQQVIGSIAATLQPFDDDNLIPAFGFGDEEVKGTGVFPFIEDGSPCKGFQHVLSRYEEILHAVVLSGPTNFAPLIRKAIQITEETQGYHILIIIADGQVEKDEEEATRRSIIEASFYPLSIILIGVGDGPWDEMLIYDKMLPARQFDNFQFVDYHECVKKSIRSPELNFALHALMEIPDQYKKLKSLGIINDKNKKQLKSINAKKK